MKERPLTFKEANFVANRLRGVGVADSYRAAYDVANSSHETVSVRASELERKPKIQRAIAEGKKQLAEAAMVDMLWVVNEWVTIANADPSELTKTVHDACRHCWGFNHAYQWRDENEWAAEMAKAVENGKPGPSMDGGFGFRRLRGPHPECPQCEGKGVTRVEVADMRHVSPAARKLFAGVEQTKNGIKVLTRSQDGAVLNIAKALGGIIDKVQHSGSVGVASTSKLTDEQRALVLKGLQGLL